MPYTRDDRWRDDQEAEGALFDLTIEMERSADPATRLLLDVIFRNSPYYCEIIAQARGSVRGRAIQRARAA